MREPLSIHTAGRLVPLAAAAVAITAGLRSLPAAEPPETLAVGSPAPNFALPGVDGRTHSLADYKDRAVLVVAFTCNHCPTAQAYEARLIRFTEEYADRGVAVVAISPNDPKAVRLDELGYSIAGDSFEDMKVHAKEYGFNFPYLYDGESQSVSRAFGVKATPHVFVFDRDRILRYAGAIDDNEKGDAVKRHFLRDAVDAVLAGQPVAEPTTRAFGCSTKWSDKRDSVRQSDEDWKARPVTLETIDAAGARALAANRTKKLRLINLWATWCGPCLAEFPDLVALNRIYQNRGFEVVTISIDDPAKRDDALTLLKRFHAAESPATAESLKEEGRTTNNLLFAGDDRNALAEAIDPEWEGPIPHTILVAPGGKVLWRHSGELDPVEARKAIVGFLGRTY